MDKGILELESKLGLEPGFFKNLQAEDDWSFVIKLHALFEAACTHLLLFHFREPNLTELLSRMELSGRPVGKLAMLGELGLLGSAERRFIAALSELRNSLVHDVRNHRYSLSEMVAALNPEKLRQFAITFSPFETGVRTANEMATVLGEKALDGRLTRQADITALIFRARGSPKTHIWLGATAVLTTILDMYGYSDYKQWVKAAALFDEEAD